MRKGGEARHSFSERVLGAFSLREDMFAEIIADATANQHAIRALVLGSLGPAIGAAFVLGIVALPFFFVIGMVVWVVYGAIVYFLATRFFATASTVRNPHGFARAIAFAGLPRFIQIIAFHPVLSLIFGIIAVVWTVAATVIGVRLSLKLTNGRSAAAALVGAAVQFVLTGLLSL